MTGPDPRWILLLSLLPLTGCGLSKTLFPTATPEDISGNWQLSSTNTTPTTANNILLVGAFVSNGANVTGTFRLTDIAPGNSCGPVAQVITATGSIDYSVPEAQILNMTAPVSGSVLKLQVALNARLQGAAGGTVTITGPTCNFAQSPLAAIEYPTVTGTFAGTLSPVTSVPNNTAPAGTASLAVTQGPSPNPDGSFPVTGSITYTGSACTSTTAVTGTTSGAAVTLASAINPLTTSSFVTFAGANTPLSAQIATPQLQAGAVVYYPPPCSTSVTTTATYSATLTKQ